MKFSEFYRITLNTAIDLLESSQLNPWTKIGVSFTLGALRGKGVEGALSIPMVNQLIQFGGKLGLVNGADDTVDLPGIIAGLENTVKEGREVDLGFFILDNKDVRLLISNLKKEQSNGGPPSVSRPEGVVV
jgi:hypothetical protein